MMIIKEAFSLINLYAFLSLDMDSKPLLKDLKWGNGHRAIVKEGFRGNAGGFTFLEM